MIRLVLLLFVPGGTLGISVQISQFINSKSNYGRMYFCLCRWVLPHTSLSRRRKCLCHILGTTLWLCSSSSLDFTNIYEMKTFFCYLLEIQNIFVPLLRFSTRGVMIENISRWFNSLVLVSPGCYKISF